MAPRPQGQAIDAGEYKSVPVRHWLPALPEPDSVTITTTKVDDEIAKIAGPQLVVPVMNARYALNAANARWGSLYDAFYGTDIIPESPGKGKGTSYNPARGELVVARVAEVLDAMVPLAQGSHSDVVAYGIGASDDGQRQLRAILQDGGNTPLADPKQFVGFVGEPEPSSILLVHNESCT